MDAPSPVVLSDAHGPVKRAIFGVLGLAAIVLPVWDLWPGLVHLWIFAPVIWVIVLGAISVGSAFLYAAVLGDSTELVVEDGRIWLTRQNLLRQHSAELAPGDIRAVGVREIDWESRAATYAVEITLATGRRIGSQEFGKRAAAEALAQRFALAIGRG